VNIIGAYLTYKFLFSGSESEERGSPYQERNAHNVAALALLLFIPLAVVLYENWSYILDARSFFLLANTHTLVFWIAQLQNVWFSSAIIFFIAVALHKPIQVSFGGRVIDIVISLMLVVTKAYFIFYTAELVSNLLVKFSQIILLPALEFSEPIGSNASWNLFSTLQSVIELLFFFLINAVCFLLVSKFHIYIIKIGFLIIDTTVNLLVPIKLIPRLLSTKNIDRD
jgi:hypothetical protein